MNSPRTHFLGVPVDLGSQILGYLHAILICIGLILTAVYLGVCVHEGGCHNSNRLQEFTIVMSTGIFTAGGLSLTLAVLLITGIKNRESGFVLTYFIFGVMKVITLTLLSMFSVLGINSLILVIVLVVYSALLGMVYSSYHNIKLEKEQNNMNYKTSPDSFYNNLPDNLYKSLQVDSIVKEKPTV